MVTKVIIFTILFLIAWIATINIFRIVCNKSMIDSRELTLRVKVIDYIKYEDYNVIKTEISDRSYEIRDPYKAFRKEVEDNIGSYATITVRVMYIGCIILEPVLVIKDIKSGYYK